MPKKNEPAPRAMYRATAFHELAVSDGTKNVYPGYIVVTEGDDVNAYPEERFVEAFPDVDVTTIPEQE